MKLLDNVDGVSVQGAGTMIFKKGGPNLQISDK